MLECSIFWKCFQDQYHFCRVFIMQPESSKDYTKKNDPLRVKRTLVLVGWKNPESLEKVDRQVGAVFFRISFSRIGSIFWGVLWDPSSPNFSRESAGRSLINTRKGHQKYDALGVEVWRLVFLVSMGRKGNPRKAMHKKIWSSTYWKNSMLWGILPVD